MHQHLSKNGNKCVIHAAGLAQKLAKKYLATSPAVKPKSVLPACYYLACVAKGIRKTQAEISLTYGVSTPTIRKVWKDVVKRVKAIGDRDYDELAREYGGEAKC